MKIYAYLWGLLLLFLNSYNFVVGIMIASLLIVILSGLGVLFSLLFIMQIHTTEE
ncbi:hypothetical protein [Enterococcus sp.]|uniref:hypothetical protein n=1 Tax=Enterococcus sp. TaxID=35783 RepID=UPI002FC8CE58